MSTSADAIAQLNRSVEQLLRQQEASADPASGHLFWSTVNARIRRRALRRAAIVVLVVVGLGVAIGQVPTLGWTAAAVGRLALIRGALPWWDWRRLDGDLCLWEMAKTTAATTTADTTKTTGDFGRNNHHASSDMDNLAEDCDFCENIDHLVHLRTPPNVVDFEHYVRFNQPILIAPPPKTSDDATIWTPSSLREQLLLADSRLTSGSAPVCDLRSNILLGPSPSLNQIVEHTLDRPSRPNATGEAGWYIAYRNCGPGATRATRPLWPRPAWMPLHLRPYATSWLVMSQGAAADSQATSAVIRKVLRLRGLAVMTQLCGTRLVRVEPVASCAECDASIMTHRLQAGESIVFAADRWRLEYETGADNVQDGGELSVSFVAEFEWEY